MASSSPNPPAQRSGTPKQVLGLFWWRLFAVELPIVAATVAYWWIAPQDFLATTFGIAPASPAMALLLWQYAASVASMVLWLYARLLFAPTLDLRSFRLYQEALLVGDVGVVAVGVIGLAQATLPPVTLAGIGMATLWGAIRLTWLMRSRRAAVHSESNSMSGLSM